MAHVRPISAWGEVSFFVNPGGLLKRGAYFSTIKQKDGAHDRASALDRGGLWRVNFGLPKGDFAALFCAPPARPVAGGVVAGPWDFTALDVLTPHPVYGWMGWVAILNPSVDSMARLRQLIVLAHGKALQAAQKRLAKEAV